MKTLSKCIIIIFGLIFVFYLLLPNPAFPEPPPGALQSNESADTETSLRRAYFTNFTREEVMLHYSKQFSKSTFSVIPLPTFRLNYPPEEAQTVIRDQTRSTFLEEIVHPFRESLFVNGFEPRDPKDVVFIENKVWRQKITIRLVPSKGIVRLVVATFALLLIGVVSKEWVEAVADIFKKAKK
ncbi:MAG: hypothetical protein WBD86_02730 [Microgenomates group bacterium]